MTVVSFSARGGWAADARGEGRAVRVSSHDERVGTFHVGPVAAADLVAALNRGLTRLTVPRQVTPIGDRDDREDRAGAPH
jgi:hypothetical protein